MTWRRHFAICERTNRIDVCYFLLLLSLAVVCIHSACFQFSVANWLKYLWKIQKIQFPYLNHHFSSIFTRFFSQIIKSVFTEFQKRERKLKKTKAYVHCTRNCIAIADYAIHIIIVRARHVFDLNASAFCIYNESAERKKNYFWIFTLFSDNQIKLVILFD